MTVQLPRVDIDPEKITTLADAKEAITRLLNIVEELIGTVKHLMEENHQLREEISRLKKQPPAPRFTPGNTSSNRSSENLLKEKQRVWHKSVKKQHIPVDTEVAVPDVPACSCGNTHFTTLRTRQKVLQGLVIRRNNTRYHGRDKRCVACGRIYHAQFPQETKGLEFDAPLWSFVSYLKHFCRMTEGLILRFLTDLGIIISHGEITHMLRTNSEKLAPSYAHLRIWGIKKSRYLQTDATGRKRRAKTMLTQHLQFVGHALLSVFTITASYNSTTVAFALTKRGSDKPLVSDDGSPNGRRLPGKKKQLCWRHEIGHYLKLMPHCMRHKKVISATLVSLRQFYHAAKGYSRDPTEAKRRKLKRMFDALTNQTTGYNRLDERLRLTAKKRDRLLLFLEYPFLPIHNNQSEQDLREPVIQRKISGETKSVKGDRSIERHLSVIQTARKQGLNIFITLHGLLTGELSPTILTAQTV